MLLLSPSSRSGDIIGQPGRIESKKGEDIASLAIDGLCALE